MILAAAGWFVIHALWTGGFVGGLAALLLAILGDQRARLRYAIAYGALMLMILVPLAITATSVDFYTRGTRLQVTGLVEHTVGMPTFVAWRGPLVRGAAVLWMAGLFVGIVAVARAWRRSRVIGRADAIDCDPIVRRRAASIAAKLGVTRDVRILASPVTDVPMVYGWRRVTMILPLGVGGNLDATQLNAVIAHELAHVRRLDYLANLLQLAADVILWFHPLARRLSQRARLEREYCCDDDAVRVTDDRVTYVQALARLEDARHEGPVVAVRSSHLLDRIQRLVGEPRPVVTPLRAATGLVVTIVLASVVAMLAQVVPPQVPLDAKLRSRSPRPSTAVQSGR
jgi:beta-lactamase regulating signal transducer with metallopeptidase domain